MGAESVAMMVLSRAARMQPSQTEDMTRRRRRVVGSEGSGVGLASFSLFGWVCVSEAEFSVGLLNVP